MKLQWLQEDSMYLIKYKICSSFHHLPIEIWNFSTLWHFKLVLGWPVSSQPGVFQDPQHHIGSSLVGGASHHQSPFAVYRKLQLYNCPRGAVAHSWDSPAKFLTGATVVACWPWTKRPKRLLLWAPKVNESLGTLQSSGFTFHLDHNLDTLYGSSFYFLSLSY